MLDNSSTFSPEVPTKDPIPPQTKDVGQMTVEELKIVCYDQIVILNQTQQNVNILQQEIAKRQKS